MVGQQLAAPLSLAFQGTRQAVFCHLKIYLYQARRSNGGNFKKRFFEILRRCGCDPGAGAFAARIDQTAILPPEASPRSPTYQIGSLTSTLIKVVSPATVPPPLSLFFQIFTIPSLPAIWPSTMKTASDSVDFEDPRKPHRPLRSPEHGQREHLRQHGSPIPRLRWLLNFFTHKRLPYQPTKKVPPGPPALPLRLSEPPDLGRSG